MEHRLDPIVSVITPEYDLERLVADINAAQWDEANEMGVYDVDSLREYLNAPDNVFVACYAVADSVRTLMGFASSRFQLKPYDRERWLYVDEVDVCVDQRQKGAGKAIMTTLINIARANGCAEV